MQMGFVGLGKMGANMVHRVHRDSANEMVVFDFSKDAVDEAVAHGATPASSLEEMVAKLSAPRAVWIMVPSGDPTEETVEKLLGLLAPGDLIVDGGNSKWTDSKRRAAHCSEQGVEFVDVGTSGGVWGLKVGYCMMVGGSDGAVARVKPILDVLAPPDGWGHMGPSGSGHYVKMVHNGIEYGVMQAYAEGFEVLHASEYELDNAQIAQPLEPRVGDPLVAVRARRARVRGRRQRPRQHRGLGRGLRRGALDDRRRDRPRRADAGDHRGALRAPVLAFQR